MKFIKHDDKIINIKFLESVELSECELYLVFENQAFNIYFHSEYYKNGILKMVFQSFYNFIDSKEEMLFDIDHNLAKWTHLHTSTTK